ncbi:MAG: DNA repair protein RecN [Rhodoferax sp.]|nr:DNA repair protein RecN [Rhodoferax sp.]
MALKRLTLRDFVIVAELELDLSAGFTVLTGETGAGKSILIDALQLVTGGRADSGAVREGAARAEVSAEFDTTTVLQAWLAEAGFDGAEGLLLRRTLDTQGRSRAWINGSPATAGQLRELGEQLLDIHGQHAWQSLTRADAVRGLLDGYGGLATAALTQCWQAWREAQTRLSQAQQAQHTQQSERDRLAWQLHELEQLAPGRDEWEELGTEHSRLANAQALLDAAQAALDGLDDDEQGVLRNLHRAAQALRNQEHVEPVFKGLGDVLASSLAQAEDAAHALRGYLRRTELDPQRLAQLDERMGRWVSLARRLRREPAELPALLADTRQALQQLDAAADLQALQAAERGARQALQAEATRVSRARQQAAPRLAQAITEAMQGLGMAGGCFDVGLQPLPGDEPAQHGLEDVVFRVAGHAGSTPRPVAKVASGGELSRIALAIAVTTSRLGTAQTLIFDEVDAGVGGAVAETVGRLMQRLGQDRQVLAVTHLPQVAACADAHLVVAKRLQQGLTLSTVSPVAGEQRVAELARMLGGERLSGTTLAHARELLQPPA